MASLLTRPVPANLALAATYVLLGTVTLTLGSLGGVELRGTVWLASGVAVAAALLRPFPLWPGVMLGGALTSLLNGSAWPVVLLTGVANGLKVQIGATLLRRARWDPTLASTRDVLLLLGFASGVGAAVAAVPSVASLVLAGDIRPADAPSVYVLWWLTHAMGILTLTPVLLIWARPQAMRRTHDPVEIAAVLSVALLFALVPFSAPEGSFVSRLFFIPVPVLIWAAVRFGMPWAAGAGALTTAIAMAASVARVGPFSFDTTKNEQLALTWIFCNVVLVATLVAGALVEGLDRSRAAHELGERRLRAVLDAASEGIVVADEQGTVTHVNRAAGRIWPDRLPVPMLGRSVRPALEALAAEANPAPGRPGAPHTPAEVLDADPTTDRIQQMLSIGGERTWDVTLSRLGGETQDEWIWSIRDLTERVRAEAERHALEAQLLHTQKLESLGILAGGIAHDFNNLLAAIRGNAELASLEPGVPAAVREELQALLGTVDEAAALCRQMLAYAGRGPIEIRTIDLADSARGIQEMLRASVSRQVRLELALAAEPLPVAGDVTQLRQVALNLVTNAAEAVEATGRGGTVRVRARRAVLDREWLDRQVLGAEAEPGAYAILEVEDDGVGMPPEVARRIFDPFFSSKGTGRGLGLASTLGVIRSHRGALALETEPGRGSRFQVALPIATAPAAPTARAPMLSPPAHLLGRTVLVVDDEPAVRSVVARLLVKMGMRVRTASDGDEALLQLTDPAGHDIDIVLLDVMMPNLSGPATIAAMRERDIRVPVVMASGFSDQAVPRDAGIAGFVQKPFTREVLLEALGAALVLN